MSDARCDGSSSTARGPAGSQQRITRVACVCAAIEQVARKPTQVRQFLNVLGMRPRRVGVLPAKADVAAQEALKKMLWSLG